MKKAFLLASASLFTTTFSYAAGEGWMQDFEAAKLKASEMNKDLLLDFTGSDWCPPCKDLSSRILSQDSFKTEASKNYILVELDFPNDKSKITPAISAQNQELLKLYEVKGYPTILLIDAQGRPYGQTGHRPGTPEDYLAHLAELQKNKESRDAEFAKAEKAEGAEKAKALYAGLKNVPENHYKHYSETIEAIKANDPDDESGMMAEKARKEAAAKVAAEFQQKMAGLEKDLSTAIEANDTSKAMSLIDEFIVKEKLEGQQKQQTLSIKINVLMRNNDLDGIEKVADDIIAINPEGNFSKMVRSFKETRLQDLKKEKAQADADKKEEVPAEKK